MLYISRRVGQNKFGVTDTEDGVEDVVSLSELNEAVLDNGIEIMGVETMIRNKTTGRRVIRRVHVYQDDAHVSRAQAKLKVFKNIHVKLHDSEIVSITWPDNPMVKGQSIRLSDYGTSCSGYLFNDLGYFFHGDGPWVTIILDDKISWVRNSFKRVDTSGVVVDLREVSDNKKATYVYQEMIASYGPGASKLQDFIIDKQERLDYWRAIAVLNKGAKHGENFTNIRDIVSDEVAINAQIATKYTREFTQLANMSFAFKERAHTSSFVDQYIKLICSDEGRWVLDCRDYSRLCNKEMTSLFRLLKFETNCNQNAVIRFENYINFFDVTPELQQIFVTMCLRAHRWLASGHLMG